MRNYVTFKLVFYIYPTKVYESGRGLIHWEDFSFKGC